MILPSYGYLLSYVMIYGLNLSFDAWTYFYKQRFSGLCYVYNSHILMFLSCQLIYIQVATYLKVIVVKHFEIVPLAIEQPQNETVHILDLILGLQ